MITKNQKLTTGPAQLVTSAFCLIGRVLFVVKLKANNWKKVMVNQININTDQRQKSTAGFTLIEMLVYLAIFIVLVMAITSSLVYLSKSYQELAQRKNLTNSAVSVLNRISFETRQASSINIANSVFGTSSSRLYLDSKNTDGSNTNYDFYLDSSVLKLKKDGVDQGALTLPGVAVNSFEIYRPVGTSTNAVTVKMSLTSGTKTGDFGTTAVIRGL
ncbi:MAG: type II secretion system protein [bacterium]